MQLAFSQLREWARAARREVIALWIAAGDPRTPWQARAAAAFVAAYALSPIDLIPDFIPVLGHLDDLVLVPLGILLVIRLIPTELMAEYRAAAEVAEPTPSWHGAAVIIAAWLVIAVLLAWLLWAERTG